MTVSIRNCKFAFRCDRKWTALISTDNPDIRFCDDCQQEVFFCYTDSDVAEGIVRNRCIAIEVVNHLSPDYGSVIMGSPRERLDE